MVPEPRVVSVNVSTPRLLHDSPRLRSSIDRRPVDGPVAVGEQGLAGDRVTATKWHGGVTQAVYAFAREDLDTWAEELGRTPAPGSFGENLTVQGIDLNACVMGERWHVGTALFRVSSVRVPCATFARWMAVQGFDADGWVRRFARRGRSGVYLAVLEPGEVRAGDPVAVTHRPDHGLTSGTVFAALTTDRSLLPALVDVEDVPDDLRAKARAHVARARP